MACPANGAASTARPFPVIANKERGEHAYHRDSRADGQVDAARRDDERLTERQNREDRCCCRTLVALRSEKKLPLSRENTMIRMTSATRGPSVGIDRRKLSLRESPAFRPVATVFDAGGLIDLPFELRKLRP
jgi:hypothetical protein